MKSSLSIEHLEPRQLLSAQWVQSNFGGNPYVDVTAISGALNSDQITKSRASGELPFFVQVSASGVTASGTDAFGNGSISRPYEDLQYKWDFGDTGTHQTLTNPANGTTVDADTDQTGPEAAYVYRTEGTYTITLTVDGMTSSGTLIHNVFKTQVTASAWSGSS